MPPPRSGTRSAAVAKPSRRAFWVNQCCVRASLQPRSLLAAVHALRAIGSLPEFRRPGGSWHASARAQLIRQPPFDMRLQFQFS